MMQKWLSFGSFILALILFVPLAYTGTHFERVSNFLWDSLFRFGFYSPLVLVAAGFAVAWFGVKGIYRKLLMGAHTVLFGLYAFFLFVARFGFQQP